MVYSVSVPCLGLTWQNSRNSTMQTGRLTYSCNFGRQIKKLSVKQSRIFGEKVTSPDIRLFGDVSLFLPIFLSIMAVSLVT